MPIPRADRARTEHISFSGVPAPSQDPRLTARITFVFVAAGLALTWVIEGLVGSSASLTTLDFGYGEKIARVMAGEGLGDATRLPAIPYALGLFGRLLDDPLAATLAKNALLLVPLGWVLARVWIDGPRDPFVIVGIAFLLSFPQLVRHTLTLVPEEGWVIPLVAFAFHAFLMADRSMSSARIAVSAAAIAVLVLVKSTMLLAAPVLAAMLAVKCGRRRASLLAIGLVAAAILGLAALHFVNSGRFTPTSSLSGYDFWKGNNIAALTHFPTRSLDAIGDLAPPWTDELGEWEWHRRCLEAGLDFWRERPADAIELTRRKLVQVFVRVTGEDSPSNFAGRDFLKAAGVLWMTGFRLAMWSAIGLALWTLVRAARDGCPSREAVLDAAGFLLLLAALSLPFVIAWGSERRLMPMVIPVFLYLWSIRRRRATRAQPLEARA